MSTDWFYESMGQVVGPLSATQLLQKVRAGEISENTQVRKDDSQWVNASDVTGLFDAAQRAAVTYRCPYCGGKIDKPPAVCFGCDREVTAAYRKRESVPAPATPPTHSSPNTAERQEPNGEETLVHSVVSWFKSWVR